MEITDRIYEACKELKKYSDIHTRERTPEMLLKIATTANKFKIKATTLKNVFYGTNN